MEWLTVAARHCPGRCERVREELRRAETHHDSELVRAGLGQTTLITPDGLPEVPVFTRYQPIDASLTSEVYQRSLLRYEKERRLVVSGENIKPRERPTELKFLSKTFHRMWYYGHNTTRDLCAGKKLARRRDDRYQCHHLHYQNNYLRLGPFKYELLSSDPHVGMFRDFYSPAECQTVRNRAEGNIKSTPFTAEGRTKYFTTQRVSKRLHITEDQLTVAAQSSRRISLATNWIVDQVDHSRYDV